MKVEKLFKVLVVGGAMMAGCATARPVPDAPPVPKPSEAAKAQAPVDGEKAEPNKTKKAEAEELPGVCAWF